MAMGGRWGSHQVYPKLLLIFLTVYACDSQEQALNNAYTISSSSYPKTLLKPYQWRYIRVDLPPWFHSLAFSLETDVHLDIGKNNASSSSSQIICVREGSPPLPDVYNTSQMGLVMDYISNDSFVGTQTRSLQNFEKCYPLQKTISLRLTYEQISPGAWYFGLFNGIGPARTQSKMINRGNSYSFSGNVSVEGCTTSMTLGRFCNQTVIALSCNSTGTGLYDACTNADTIICHENTKIYALDVMEISERLTFAVRNLTFNGARPSNSTRNLALACYARHGAMPSDRVYDFSGDLSEAPLVIDFPKAGRWYISIRSIDASNETRSLQRDSSGACYLLEWRVLQCPPGKAGSNCGFERYVLRALLRKNPSLVFESNFIPITRQSSSSSPNFPLEPLLSNISAEGNSNADAWTFFLLDIPGSATGANIHVLLTSESKISDELYARHGGLPSLTTWDYFYANCTNNSISSSSSSNNDKSSSNSNNNNNSMFFKIYDSSEKRISFYILYAKGGTWSIGLRRLNSTGLTNNTMISLSLERCPNKCSSHGSCEVGVDAGGLTLYSFCDCDRNHGGFDCSIEIVSHRGHIRQSIFLIASNAAAVLPIYWSLRNKAFAEWVLFTSSGISSALYHACDVGTWCVLPFHVLQFMDFWLSFMAVVTTLVYLSTIDEASKRTIHTILAIVTALLAETGPTRPKNIGFVFGLGAVGLLVGWLIEFGARNRSFSISGEFHLNLHNRWETTRGRIRGVMKAIVKRFRWGFLIAGFAAFAMAATCWIVESTDSYWIWHSVWHVCIYTSSFLFLYSQAKVKIIENESSSSGNYALTRQDSFGRSE